MVQAVQLLEAVVLVPSSEAVLEVAHPVVVAPPEMASPVASPASASAVHPDSSRLAFVALQASSVQHISLPHFPVAWVAPKEVRLLLRALTVLKTVLLGH